MPVTVTLTTCPAHLIVRPGHTLKILDVFGKALAAETLHSVSTVADITAAVARFGAKLRAAHPEVSFLVLVHLADGDLKPAGFDAAQRGNGFGQDNFMQFRTGDSPATSNAEVPGLTRSSGERP